MPSVSALRSRNRSSASGRHRAEPWLPLNGVTGQRSRSCFIDMKSENNSLRQELCLGCSAYSSVALLAGQPVCSCLFKLGLNQGLRHADENGGGGTGTRRQRIRDFRQRKPIPKTENSADLAHYFPENGGIIPRSLKNGGDASPPSPPVAEPLV